MPASTLSTKDILSAIREHYTPFDAVMRGTDEWSVLTEVPSYSSPALAVPPLTGKITKEEYFAYREATKVRLIDVLLLRNWGGKPNPYERIAGEIKVTRGDFFKDTPQKRAPWEALVHRFTYITPEGLVSPDEVPDGCWLLEVMESPCSPDMPGHKQCSEPRRVHWNRKVRGERRDPGPIPTEIAILFARWASRGERKLAYGQEHASDESVVEELRAAKQRIIALEERGRARQLKAKQLAELVAPLLPQECAVCGEPIRPAAFNRNSTILQWQHEKKTSEVKCSAIREALKGKGTVRVEPVLFRELRRS